LIPTVVSMASPVVSLTCAFGTMLSLIETSTFDKRETTNVKIDVSFHASGFEVSRKMQYAHQYKCATQEKLIVALQVVTNKIIKHNTK